jgi:hypothetical protein
MTDKEKTAEKLVKIGVALDGICSKEEIKKAQVACDPEKEEAAKKAEDEATEKEEAEAKQKAEDMEAEEKEKQAAEDAEAEAAGKKPEPKVESAEDSFAKLAPLFAARDALVEQVAPLVGAFDSATMTAKQVAVYACDKLKLVCTADEALPLLKGYLLNVPEKTKQFALDAAVVTVEDKSLTKYLNVKEG